MNFILSRFLLILLLCWLPILGVAAQLTHCSHGSDAGQELTFDGAHGTNHLLSANPGLEKVDNSMDPAQLCEINTVCHTSCSMLVTAYSSGMHVSATADYVSLDTKASSFIPDLLLLPPRG